MKMFKAGVEGGKPTSSKPGMQPEWFYKGTGRNVVACGNPLRSPDFAEDHGEEPEVVGLYLIDDNGRPHRSGSRSATNSPITSPSAATIYCSPIRSCASAASARCSTPALFPPISKARAASAAMAR